MSCLLEHAARVLDHQPSRSMAADALHGRVTRETGIDMSCGRFLDMLRAATDRFAVIPPDPVLGTIAEWDTRQRSLYETAMEAAGITQPLVILAARRTEGDPLYPDERAPAGAVDVLLEVQDALAGLLQSADPGDLFHGAVTAAMDELHTVRRVLRF
jgi:hypothetical protein